MPVFFLILLVVFGATDGLAQQSPEATAGTAPISNMTTPVPESGRPPATKPGPTSGNNTKRPAALTGIQTACVHPGDSVTIEGNNLGMLDRKLPALDVDGNLVVLDILNRTNDRFVVRLPREGVIPGRVYPLMLVEIVTLRRIQDAVLRVRVCPIIGTRVTDSGNEREILIFADQIRKPAILQELRNRNIELLGNTDLDALGSVLIRARSDTPERAINDLRVALPDSEIDLNNDLSANDGPRLYMKKKISWPENDSCLTGAVTLSIGVIDGEVDQGHPAFKGQRIFSKNFLRGQSPDKQHATAIASILIGNAPELGLDGLLPGADLYSAIVLRQASGENRLAHVGAIVEGLNWLLSKKLRLINMSLASDVRNNVLVAAVEKSLARGAIIFAAAGNQGPQAPSSYPAVIDGVIAVTAIDAAEYIYDAANQGDYIDFSAPGVDIWAAVLEGGGYVTGTSFAAPIALAVAALLQQKNPSISREVILRALSFNSRDLGATGKDQIFGEGLLQGNC